MNQWGKQGLPFLFIIDFPKENGVAYPLSELPEDIRFSIRASSSSEAPSPLFKKHPISLKDYRISFDKAQKALQQGSISYLNLTATTAIETPLNLRELYASAHARYKILYKDEFACFSPETFVTIKNNRISAFPIKGTLQATSAHRIEELLKNPKEIEEHQQAVQLVQRDLEKIAEKVYVKRFRYVEKIKTHQGVLWQTVSEIVGQLPAGFQAHLGDIFNQITPAGSICGNPREASLKLLHQIELHQRKFYTGIFGVFDGRNLDSAVLIRFFEKTPHGLVYKSGGGITAQSKIEKEYQELISKIYVPTA